MDRSDVLRVYDDEDFAAGYDERFVLPAWPKHGIDFEVGILRELIGPGDRWLDLGCGTGWVLSQFPEVDRMGLDISPAMLEQARKANPGVPFRQGDFTEDVEELHGAWSVVSCMWMAYCYLESMPEVEALVANMARWTAPGGSVFLPSVIDLEDLRPHVQVPYEEHPDVWGGRIALTGYTWTWEEPNGNVNANMMAVHVGHFVRLLEPHFQSIEVVRYPLFQPGFVSRKAVVATGRRPAGQTGRAKITWHPIPRHPDDVAAEEAAEAARAREAAEEEAARAADVARREEAARAEGRAEGRAQGRAEEVAQRSELLAQGLAEVRADLAALTATVDHALAPPEEVADLSATPTRRLATEVGRRVNPLAPGFWRRAGTRLRR